MSRWTLQEWSAVAIVLYTVITFAGVLGSFYIATRTLRELQADRRLRHQPRLAFDGFGYRLPIQFVKAGLHVPGVNPSYAERRLAALPVDGESVRLKVSGDTDRSKTIPGYGNLRNFGLGPALETRVTWIPESVTIGAETFTLNKEKLREARYSPELNDMPLVPGHIASNESSVLSRLPAFIEKDFEKKVAEVRGSLRLECLDVFGEKHTFRQSFFIGTGYRDSPPWVHVTFTDLRDGA